MNRVITRWKDRWNNSFPLRLAMRTGIYLALVLFLIITCSYVSMAWLLNRSTDATLAMNAGSIIKEWGVQERIIPVKWHGLSYRVLQTDGTPVEDNAPALPPLHGHFDHHHMPNSSEPSFSVRTEENGPLLTGSQAMLYQLLPLGNAERVVTIPFTLGPEHYLLEASIPLQDTHNFLGSVLAVFAVIALGGFLLILRVINGSTKKGFLPVEQIAHMLKDVQERTLSTRLEFSARDRTLDELVEVLNNMLGRLDQAFQSQSRFVQDASHELRTPLSVLRSDIEITLRRTRSEEEYRESLTRCLAEVEHMSRLTQQLLTLARYDQSSALTMQDVQLPDVLERVIGKAKAAQNAQQVQLIVELQEPGRVTGEPVALEMLFSNLLHNAVRAMDGQGTITVRTRTEGDFLITEIADTGVGIPTEAIPRLFDRLYRVDDARNREMGGTGLGLAICHSIVQAHHGRIEVSSELGVGSTFTVFLPLHH